MPCFSHVKIIIDNSLSSIPNFDDHIFTIKCSNPLCDAKRLMFNRSSMKETKVPFGGIRPLGKAPGPSICAASSLSYDFQLIHFGW